MTVTGPAEVERLREVNEQMNELDSAIASLDATLDGLEPRLEKVLSMKTESGEKDVAVPETGLCTLAHEIRQFRYRIENISANVRDIFSRLEL